MVHAQINEIAVYQQYRTHASVFQMNFYLIKCFQTEVPNHQATAWYWAIKG